MRRHSVKHRTPRLPAKRNAWKGRHERNGKAGGQWQAFTFHHVA